MKVDREDSLGTRTSLLEVTGKSQGCVNLGTTAQGTAGNRPVKGGAQRPLDGNEVWTHHPQAQMLAKLNPQHFAASANRRAWATMALPQTEWHW